MAWIGFHKVAGALVALARPISDIYGDAAKREATKAAAQADGQVKYGPKKPKDAPPAVACAAAVGQIVSLEAKPPLVWLAPRAAWRCEGDGPTRISLKLADGSATEHVYPAGTLIPVAAGMVLFPQEEGGA